MGRASRIRCGGKVPRRIKRGAGFAASRAMNKQKFYHLSELEDERKQIPKLYLEFLRVPSMSAGIYLLSPGQTDPQSPHAEDELYYVLKGRARMKVGSEDQSLRAGDLVFVEAGVEHRFYQISEELLVLVFFAPAESG